MGEVKLFRLSGSAAVIDLRTGNNATLRPGLVVLSEDAHTHAIATLEAENAKLKGEYEWVASINTALDESNQSAWAENAKLLAELERRAMPDGFRVMRPTSTILSEGDRWEIYAPCGSGGIVNEDDVTDWVVRKLLDALAAAPSPSKQGGE